MYRSLFIVMSTALIKIVNCDASNTTDTRKYFTEVDGDLTRVVWAHRTNTRSKLEAALSNPGVMMIESDVKQGHLQSVSEGDPMPVMGRPSDTTQADISLEQFLHKVLDKKAGKGIKLHFTSLAAFKASEIVLEEFLAKAEEGLPVWFYADILRGPGVSATHPVVDAKYFLETCVNKFPNVYISPGWAVNFSDAEHLRYEKKHIEEMQTALLEANVVHGVTFPVHAGIASNSLETLPHLVKTAADGTTLTFWSVAGDWVDYKNVRLLIDSVGKDKVYIDIPKDMLEKLHAPEAKAAATALTVGATTTLLVLLGLLGTILPALH